MIEVIEDDICASDTKYIAHQTNLISAGASGVAKAIFNDFPYSNTYRFRAVRNYVANPNLLGNLEIMGDGKDKRFIINMNAQFYPGGNNQYTVNNKTIDTAEMREYYFKLCLENIAAIENIESISFPYLIGCGLGGGNWENYYQMLTNFANKIEKEQNAKTYLYKLDV